MIHSGPTRVVLLNSGKYSFADVELDRCVHLVAPNNLGKTTLIAALQFLYIDRIDRMDFAYPSDATRRYYFPDSWSYIIFECLTPKGHQVLGVHGQGPTRSFSYERFRYTGSFAIEDYINEEGQSRRWEEVRSRLARRELQLVEPRDLSSLLTGLGERKRGTSFGIVPVRQRTGYERFRRVFTHLLKLGRLRQEDLKRVFIETWETDLRQREVDLGKGLRSQYEKVRAERQDVADLERLAPGIDRAVQAHQRRELLREELPGVWAGLQQALAQLVADLARAIDKEREAATARQTEATAARQQAKAHRSTLAGLNEQIGAVKETLRQLDEAAQKFIEYDVLDADATIERLDQVALDLAGRLRDVDQRTLKEVQRELQRAQSERARLRKRLERVESMLGTGLSRLASPELLGRAFGVLDDRLLDAELGPDAVIDDPAAAKQWLEELALRDSEGALHVPGLTLNPAALHPPDLERWSDLDTLREELAGQTRRAGELERLAADLEAVEPLRRQLATTKKDLQGHRRLREGYRTFVESNVQRPELLEKRESLSREIEALRSKALEKDEAARSLEEEARSAAGRQADARKRLLEVRDSTGSLEPPHWVAATDLPDGLVAGSDEFDGLLDRYRRGARSEAAAHEELRSELDHIASITYDRYQGGDDAETIDLLRQQREGLDERRQALDQLWRSLVVQLKAAFKGLADDLDTLESKKNDLNRSLAKTSVSNLDRLALRLERNRELGQYVKDVQKAEVMPLFAERSKTEQAMERIGALLEQRPRIRLEDTFDLHFEVTHPNGKVRRYDHLDRIESNGTTVTIKVLVSLHLLRALLASDRGARVS